MLEAALEELEELLHQVDHVKISVRGAYKYEIGAPEAGNLNRMGGMRPLLASSLAFLDPNHGLGAGSQHRAQRGGPGAPFGFENIRSQEAIRSLALWALGVAVQNNAPVQEELHGLQGLTRLAERLRRGGGEAFEGKLLFCLSGLLKNAVAYQLEAEQLGVNDWMMEAEHCN